MATRTGLMAGGGAGLALGAIGATVGPTIGCRSCAGRSASHWPTDTAGSSTSPTGSPTPHGVRRSKPPCSLSTANAPSSGTRRRRSTPTSKPPGSCSDPRPDQSVEVSNVGSPPAGLPAFAPDEWIVDATGSAVVIGQFAAPDTPSRRVLVVTNFSHDEPADATLTFADGVTPTSQRIRLPAGGFAAIALTRS